MIWTQGLISFGIWLAFGYVLFRQTRKLLSWIVRIPRTRRTAYGPISLLFGVFAMGGGLLIIESQGGMTPNGFTPLGWIAATVFGLIFVGSQAVGAGMMVTLTNPRVTKPTPNPSVNQDSPHENLD